MAQKQIGVSLPDELREKVEEEIANRNMLGQEVSMSALVKEAVFVYMNLDPIVIDGRIVGFILPEFAGCVTSQQAPDRS